MAQGKKEEIWLSAKMIAKKYSVSYQTARRWIMRLNGDETRKQPKKGDGRLSRPYHLRRVPQSLLEEHLDEFLNG